MNTLRCHNCGETNPASATFCAKCATWLRRPQLQREYRGKVFLPPQIDQQEPTPQTITPRSPRAGWWLISIIIVVGLIIWWLASNG